MRQTMMHTTMTLALVGMLAAGGAAMAQQEAQVEIELLTYPEIYAAIHEQGKTTVLVVNGGIEQRGPHAVLGGHSLTAGPQAVDIARKLGNALVAPVMPFSIAGRHLNPNTPGSVNIPGPIFAAVNEAIVDSMVVNGFKNIVLMGEHGGGQKELEEVARKTDAKYSPQGVHVFFCGDFYEKTQSEFQQWVIANHLPPSTHGGIPDTSLMMYLGGDAWVRKDKMVAGDPWLPPGTPRDPNTPLVNNGVIGDPRPSTPEMGKRYFDMKTKNAVAQIRALIAASKQQP
jgi:creatinine amidohydrolase/Fe(II)-dependent formamide hydrolase-like protein